MDENIYTLIGRAVNGQPLLPSQVLRIIEHYQSVVNEKTDIISRIRETLNAFKK